MYKWDPEQIEWYFKAIEKSDYPRVFVEKILPHLHSSMTVLDVGAGPGAFSLAIAPYVKQVIALEKDALALKCLFTEKNNRNLDNIHCIFGLWPGEIPHNVDVIISAFSGPYVLASKYSINEMLKTASDKIFLITPGQRLKAPFYSQKLFREKGIKMKKHASTHSDTIRILKELGVKYAVELVEYDFGQPVSSKIDGEIFLSRKLPFYRNTIKNHLQEILTWQNSCMWIPNPLYSAFITIHCKSH